MFVKTVFTLWAFCRAINCRQNAPHSTYLSKSVQS
jgi:hypothetical protein